MLINPLPQPYRRDLVIDKNVLNTQVSEEKTYIYGKHVIANLYGVSREVLNNEEFLKNLVIEAVNIAKMNLVEVKSWKFIGGDKYGVSVIALVVESHVSIHTWPEYAFATVDIYTCGKDSDPVKAFKYILEKLRPEKYVALYVDRSCRAKIVSNIDVKKVEII